MSAFFSAGESLQRATPTTTNDQSRISPQERGEACFSVSFQSCVFKHRRRKNRQLALRRAMQTIQGRFDCRIDGLGQQESSAHETSRLVFSTHGRSTWLHIFRPHLGWSVQDDKLTKKFVKIHTLRTSSCLVTLVKFSQS